MPKLKRFYYRVREGQWNIYEARFRVSGVLVLSRSRKGGGAVGEIRKTKGATTLTYMFAYA